MAERRKEGKANERKDPWDGETPYTFFGSSCIHVCSFVSQVWCVGAVVALDLPQDWPESPKQQDRLLLMPRSSTLGCRDQCLMSMVTALANSVLTIIKAFSLPSLAPFTSPT